MTGRGRWHAEPVGQTNGTFCRGAPLPGPNLASCLHPKFILCMRHLQLCFFLGSKEIRAVVQAGSGSAGWPQVCRGDKGRVGLHHAPGVCAPAVRTIISMFLVKSRAQLLPQPTVCQSRNQGKSAQLSWPLPRHLTVTSNDLKPCLPRAQTAHTHTTGRQREEVERLPSRQITDTA